MGEESGCQGARELVKRNCRYDLVIAGETEREPDRPRP
jgi:hypothetical protein